MRPSDILAQHQPRTLDGGLACTCHNWQTCLMPGAQNTSVWGFAEHLIEMLHDAGWDIVRRPA